MRIVVKVGTSTLAHATGALNIRRTAALCRVLSDVKNAGHELVLVSSGAIGMGVGKLHLPGRPADMPTKQAAAAVGQCELMYRYDKLFSEYGHTVAQVLVTGEDARDEARSANIEATLNRLLALGALPIVNENDTVSTAEIAVGDNDTLGAIVAVHLRADLLVLLTDIDGLYTADPHTDAAGKGAAACAFRPCAGPAWAGTAPPRPRAPGTPRRHCTRTGGLFWRCPQWQGPYQGLPLYPHKYGRCPCPSQCRAPLPVPHRHG